VQFLISLRASFNALTNSIHCTSLCYTSRMAVDQVVSRWPLTVEARVRDRVSPCEICGGQSGTGTGFPLSVSFHHCSMLISQPHEVCGSSKQHIVTPWVLGYGRHLCPGTWLEQRKEYYYYYYLYVLYLLYAIHICVRSCVYLWLSCCLSYFLIFCLYLARAQNHQGITYTPKSSASVKCFPPSVLRSDGGQRQPTSRPCSLLNAVISIM
jgi:hypothetical protein